MAEGFSVVDSSGGRFDALSFPVFDCRTNALMRKPVVEVFETLQAPHVRIIARAFYVRAALLLVR